MGLGVALVSLLGSFWKVFGVLWDTLGMPLGSFWALLESLGDPFGHLGVTCKLLGVFEVLWDTLGILLGTLGSLGSQNPTLDFPGELSWITY